MNKVIVVDIPATVPAEEASKMLSEPLTRGYYVRGMTSGDPMRVLFATYAEREDKCAEELRAMEIVEAHRHATATRIVQVLCQYGIYRGAAWVNKTRDEL